MNDLYRRTFDEIHASQALRQEVLNMTKWEMPTAKRRIPRMLLIAAIVILVLAGTAVAASLSGMQSWFSRQWAKETGKAIEQDQMGIITGLTDEVGVSAEADGVTVTVDSITRGEGVIWALMRLDGIPPEEEMEAQLSQYELPIDPNMMPEGWQPSKTREYRLWTELKLTPDTKEETALGGILQESRGADGVLTLLLRYDVPPDLEITALDAEEITQCLSNFTWGPRLGGQFPIGDGPWELTIPLSPIEDPPMLTTGPCRLPAYIPTPDGWDTEEMGRPPQKEVSFQEIQVSATGCTLFWASLEEAEEVRLGNRFLLVMKDGTKLELDSSGRSYYTLPDGTAVTRKPWPVPIDLGQAESLEYLFEGESLFLELN